MHCTGLGSVNSGVISCGVLNAVPSRWSMVLAGDLSVGLRSQSVERQLINVCPAAEVGPDSSNSGLDRSRPGPTNRKITDSSAPHSAVSPAAKGNLGHRASPHGYIPSRWLRGSLAYKCDTANDCVHNPEISCLHFKTCLP